MITCQRLEVYCQIQFAAVATATHVLMLLLLLLLLLLLTPAPATPPSKLRQQKVKRCPSPLQPLAPSFLSRFSQSQPAHSHSMSLSSWAQACTTAANRPLQTQLDTAYASCGVTVSWGCGC